MKEEKFVEKACLLHEAQQREQSGLDRLTEASTAEETAVDGGASEEQLLNQLQQEEESQEVDATGPEL